jgi:hypothetical protein
MFVLNAAIIINKTIMQNIIKPIFIIILSLNIIKTT